MGAMHTPVKTDFVGGFAKGLKVIEAFNSAKARLSITDVATITGFDRATSRRCLLTLCTLGFAKYDGKYFSLTAKILRLGYSYLSSASLPVIIQPFLDKLSAKLGQSSSSSILDMTEIVYIARASQVKIMSVNLTAGSRLPAWCSSMGRVLLAGLPEDERKRILDVSHIEPRTVKTCTDRKALVKKIETVAETGFCLIDQELEIGLCSIAVPIKTASGKVVAALNIGAPAVENCLQEMTTHYLPELRKTAHDISALIPVR